ILIARNLMAGGGYLVYHEEREGHAIGTLTLRENRTARACTGLGIKLLEGHHVCLTQVLNNLLPGPTFEQAVPQVVGGGFYPEGGSYGTMIDRSSTGGVSQSGNVWDDTGSPMS